MDTLVIVGAFVALFVLLFLEVPIAFGMALIGFLGLAYYLGFPAALASLGQTASDTVFVYEYAVLPLFVLMGNMIAQSRISHDLYDASNAWLGHLRGGLAHATVVACAGFSAICGSSLATAATMTKVAMPPMERYKYAPRLAAGCIASGGTLGIMIPPSVAFVFYGIMTDTDIGKLFAAGILPGILGTILYMSAITVTTWRNPSLGPPGPRTPWRGRFIALKGVLGMLALFVLVMGGIYTGQFTPVEAAGIGAAGACLIALGRRALTWRSFFAVLNETGRTSAMLLVILIGALIFSNFINVSRFPNKLADAFRDSGLGAYGILFLIIVVYVILGCIMESISMMLLTVPVFYPIVAALDFGLGSPTMTLIWFGVIVVTVIEIGMITPPIGLNVFVLKTLLPQIPLTEIFRGVTPFIMADIVRVSVLVAIPGISLLLPRIF